MCVRATVLNTALSLVPALSTLVVVLVVVTVVAAKQLVPKIDNAHAFIVIIIIFVTSGGEENHVTAFLDQRRKILTRSGTAAGRMGGESERATYAPAICHRRFHSHMLTQNYPRAAQFALIFRFFTRAALSGSSASFSVIISNRA